MTPQIAKVFESMRGKIEKNLKDAKKYGAVSDMDMARFQDIFGRKQDIIRPDAELRAKAIKQQWDVISGKTCL